MKKKPVIRAVVFDLDGLMLNTEDIFELAGQQLMERRGLEMTDAIRDRMLGRRPVEAFTALKEMSGLPDEIPALMQETKELFLAIAATHLDMMPGLAEFLHLISAKSLPCAVATSSPREYMKAMLGRFSLFERFQFALTAEDVRHGKPHPEIYLTAAQRFQLVPEQMLVLEDSETGTRAAAAAGAFVVSVPNKHTCRGDFSMCSLRVDSLLDDRLHALISGHE